MTGDRRLFSIPSIRIERLVQSPELGREDLILLLRRVPRYKSKGGTGGKSKESTYVKITVLTSTTFPFRFSFGFRSRGHSD